MCVASRMFFEAHLCRAALSIIEEVQAVAAAGQVRHRFAVEPRRVLVRVVHTNQLTKGVNYLRQCIFLPAAGNSLLHH